MTKINRKAISNISYLSLLNLVAEATAKLSKSDIRRIVDEANKAGVLKGFADWLVTQEEIRSDVLRAFRNYLSGEFWLVC
ncbi:hypothetical protein SOV_35270 [Sporomusa ovata DSM 2662]|uniref:Uncharacterized protein n=1 Tax=Sporomusa ovata TaxID=2378 RepID=A0A0U1L7B4_9FIRM|nr:hypothetical protein [Sporomusa ovata]EQB24676.1 hypothetical protein SOV_6c00900 [Sporomusa ovata DSM 2662]CQR75023.1 hypothetical protein SpAn4DRAFT_4387 [Sporomusa ovata]